MNSNQLIPLHSSSLHYTTLWYTVIHYTTLRYTTLHYTSPHHSTLLQFNPIQFTIPHSSETFASPNYVNIRWNYRSSGFFKNLFSQISSPSIDHWRCLKMSVQFSHCQLAYIDEFCVVESLRLVICTHFTASHMNRCLSGYHSTYSSHFCTWLLKPS